MDQTNANNDQKELSDINFISISFSIGVSIDIASIRVELKFIFSTKEKNNQIFFYSEFKFLCIKLYIYFEFKFLDLFPIKFEFGFNLFCLYEEDKNHALYKNTARLNAQ